MPESLLCLSMLCASSCGHRQSVRRVIQACAIYEAPEAFAFAQLKGGRLGTMGAWVEVWGFVQLTVAGRDEAGHSHN